MHLRLERWASPMSSLLLVTDSDGVLRALEFADREARMHRLLRQHYGSYILQEGAAPASLTQALDAYFKGCIDVLADMKVATGDTPFQREVWRALRAIPAGTTISYGKLAANLGEPRSKSRGRCRERGKSHCDRCALSSCYRSEWRAHWLCRWPSAQAMAARS